MDSISKRGQEHSEKVSVEGNEDRISNLPTRLIGHILSFLSTKNAVSTSVLSTKWKYLWTSIPILDFNNIAEFLERISKVECLYLSRSLMKDFELCRFSMPKFDRLTYLELVDGYVGCKLLFDFFESSPLLETLIFGGLLQDDLEENQTSSHWHPPEHVPSCLLFHLKKIEIKEFEGEIDELKMVEYFLKNSRVLEELTIHAYSGVELEIRKKVVLEICKKLLMLSRYSETCRVEVL